MSLGNDRAARGQRGGGISSCNGECEWEIAGAKHGNRAKRDSLTAEIGARKRLAFRERAIERGSEKAAFTDHGSEKTKLTGGASAFPLNPRAREPGFGHDAVDQDIAKIEYPLCDGFEESRALLKAGGPIGIEGYGCKFAGCVDVLYRASAEPGFDLLSRCGVCCMEKSFCPESGLCADELFAGQLHLATPWFC
jgi:hypothetical protein